MLIDFKNGDILVTIMQLFLREKFSIVFSVLILAIVGFAYFGIGGLGFSKLGMGSTNSNMSIYAGLELKLDFTEDGAAKVFALASSNALSKYPVLEGKPIPEKGSMVLGEIEAEIMKSEKIFYKIGDKLVNFFDINPSIEGILVKTDEPIDYFHFLSSHEFENVSGNKKEMFILADTSEAKVFFNNGLNQALPESIKLAEGKMADYKKHEIVGIKYYPVVLGFEEAKAMRSEKIFSELGDTFKKFGKNFIVIGVLEKNNSVLDITYMAPLIKEQFSEGVTYEEN